MAFQYELTLAQDRLQKVIDHLDAAGNYPALVIGSSALSGATGVLFSLTLGNPVGTISGRTMSFLGLPVSTTAIASGTAAKGELRAADGTAVAYGLTVGAFGSGADIIIDTIAVIVGKPIKLVAATIVHP